MNIGNLKENNCSVLGKYIIRTEEKLVDLENFDLPIIKSSSRGLEVVSSKTINKENLKDYLLIKSEETFVCNFFESKRFNHKKGFIHLYKGQGSAITSGKHYYTFKVNRQLINEYFLELVFASSAFKKKLKDLEKENQSFEFFPEEELKKIEVNFPNISLQKKIIKKLQIVKEQMNEKKKKDIHHYLEKIKKCDSKLLKKMGKNSERTEYRTLFLEYKQINREISKILDAWIEVETDLIGQKSFSKALEWENNRL